MVTAIWKVYGIDGHRQRQSFFSSDIFTDWSGVQAAVIGSDITGANDYVVVIFNANSFDKCERALNGQLSDGIFENSTYGKVELVSVNGDEEADEHDCI